MMDFKEIIENIDYVIEQSCLTDIYRYEENNDGKITLWIDRTGRLFINSIAMPYTVKDMMEINFRNYDRIDNQDPGKGNYIKLSFIDNRTLYMYKHGIEMVEQKKLFHDTDAILARLNYIYRAEVLGKKIHPLIIKDRCLLAYCGNAYSILIPEGVLRIGPYAFEHSKVSMVRFPASIQEIGDYAFYDCKNLRDLLFDDEEEFIGLEVFEGGEKIRAESIPERITVDVEKAFEGAEKLNVTIVEE